MLTIIFVADSELSILAAAPGVEVALPKTQASCERHLSREHTPSSDESATRIKRKPKPTLQGAMPLLCTDSAHLACDGARLREAARDKFYLLAAHDTRGHQRRQQTRRRIAGR